MSTPASSQTIERIAADIGSAVYIDVAKWHLYLRDAHLHTPLAEAVYPMLADGKLDERHVEDILKTIPVTLGGGKKTLSLLDLIPSQSFRDLMDALEECQRDL
ncbi:MAG: DUF3181 family protein [Merismopedia sp. SIO2A8]|nr:DUF3181 family protein [Symploca sp. SIO2B6]NET48039.1 DUF3181 family protein [Merismopedia sp. SIO2A8]